MSVLTVVDMKKNKTFIYTELEKVDNSLTDSGFPKFIEGKHDWSNCTWGYTKSYCFVHDD
tara:strand:- start:7851 stop:8030 length:180 start_codon:yes stop_codon:yes gene_type:complete